MEWKYTAGLFYSASVLICIMVMGILYGETSIPISILVSMMIISMSGAFLQYYIFSDRFIKKMRYTMRMIIFVVSFMLLLTANAVCFRLFTASPYIHWWAFTAILFTVFIGGTISFEIYFRIMGKKYDGLLGQYRNRETSNQ